LFGLLLTIIIYTLPGFLILECFKFKGANKILLGTAVSLAVTPAIMYSLSLVVPINTVAVTLYSLALLALAYSKRKSLRLELGAILQTHTPSNALEKTALVLMFAIITVISTYLILAPPVYWDDLTYHVPLINDFAEDGQFETYAQPKNDFELRSNRYPLLFETAVGIPKMLSPFPAWKLVPAIAFALAAYTIFLLSKEAKKPTVWGAVLFVSTIEILWHSAASFYVDIYLSMLIAGAVYFALRFLKERQKALLFASSLFIGTAILTKFTGIIFAALLIAFIAFKTRKIKTGLCAALSALAVSAAYAVSQLLSYGFNTNVGIANYGTISENGIAHSFLRNISMTASILGNFLLTFRFSPVVLVLFAASIVKNRKNTQALLNHATLLLGIGFLLATFFSKAFPTPTGLPRYLFPIYGLSCASAGAYITSIDRGLMKKIVMAMALVSILLGFFVIVDEFGPKIEYYSAQGPELSSGGMPIPNEKGIRVFFPISNAFVLGLEKTDLRDFQSYKHIDSNVCRFLTEQEIDYVVLAAFDLWKSETTRFGTTRLGVTKVEFVKNLEIEMEKKGCIEIIGGQNRFTTTLKVRR